MGLNDITDLVIFYQIKAYSASSWCCLSLCALCSYLHDEVNRLSCNEAQNYYGGVVSVIPLTLDLLSGAISELAQASTKTVSQAGITEPEQQTAGENAEDTSVNVSEKPHTPRQYPKPACKAADGWKPAWRPPGPRRM